MATATITFLDDPLDVDVRKLVGREQLGLASELEIDVITAAPVEPERALGQRCIVQLDNGVSTRAIGGVVFAFSAMAVEDPNAGRLILGLYFVDEVL